MTKPKTQEQLNRAADLRLQKQYGITLAEYDRLAEIHKQGCWICGVVPVRRLHVDHDHGWKKVIITVKRSGALWHACAWYKGNNYAALRGTKKEAKDRIRGLLKRASVRGLLCYPHNSGLQKFRDNPEFLRNAADYLEHFQNGDTDQILKEART